MDGGCSDDSEFEEERAGGVFDLLFLKVTQKSFRSMH